ncbi:MAG: hypothetical protein ACTSVY_00090 [Candidatus Helarchaeota archaeon]
MSRRPRDDFPKKRYSKSKYDSNRPKKPFKCNPSCRYGHFRCAQNKLGRKFKNKKGWWVYECRYVEDGWCEGSTCKYAYCNVRKMKTDGTCGFQLRKKKERDDWDEDEDELEEDEIIKLKKKKNIRFQDRALKKFKKFEKY